MATLRIERETTIAYNEEEDFAFVWSSSPVFQRKMERLGIEPQKTSKRMDVEPAYYRVPKSWVKIRKPALFTEETRQRRSERAKVLFGKDRPVEHVDLLVS